MRPDDEIRDDETPENGEPVADDQGGAGEAPPPATYAGRKRAKAQSGEEDAEPEQPEEPGEPTAGEPEAEPTAEAPEPEPTAEPEEPTAEEPEPEEGEQPEDLRAGFTEEFDEIERELDAELAGLGEPPDADAEVEVEDDRRDEAEEEAEVEGDEVEEAEAEVEEAEAEEGEEADVAAEEEADVEADEGEEPEAPDVADKAEATDAALAALRARAAGKGPKPEIPVAKPEAAGAEATGPAPAVAAEPEEDEDDKAPRAKRLWARFLAASLLIVISISAATSISLLVYLTDFAKGLSDNDKLASLRDQLEAVDGGDPQTILILGSDKRLGIEKDKGRSDTTILLRVDPEKDAIALLSIPRDLRVNIPGVGLAKFNEAYTAGGPDLTLEVVKQLTGIPIHHVVNINFTGFADAVNAIECVYIDVDRRYYIPPESGTAEIDVEAGYQRMCGYNALQYVRFRHFDNDLVRSARQQDFLREARQKLPAQKLIEDREELLGIFTEYTTSDIGDAVQLLELLKTFLGVQSAPVSEVHFPAELGQTYVTASDEAIQKAVDQFLNVEGTPGERPAGESPPGEEPDEPPRADRPQGDKDKPKPEDDHFEGPPMDDSTEQGQTYAKQALHKRKKNGDPMIDFPVYYPTRLAPGSFIARDSRAFVIDGPDKDVYHGYKMVVDVPGDTFGQGLTDEYYGVSGTDWVDAPILSNPSETRTIDGRDYLLFYDGDRLRLVGFKTNQGAYWVNNTLLQSLDEGQMLSIATSMREFEEEK